MLTSKKNGKSGDCLSESSPRYDNALKEAGGRERMSHLLRQERERRNLSLLEVEQRTHIPLPYLQLLEGAGNERVVPDPMYLIAPLQGYAAFLQLELGSALTDFITEVEKLPVVEQKVGRGARLPLLLISSPELQSRFSRGTLLLLLTLGSLAVVGHYSGQTGAVRPTGHAETPLSASSGPPPAPEAWTPLSASSSALALSGSPGDADQSKPFSLPPTVSPPVTAALPVKPSTASPPQVESPVVHPPLQSQPLPSRALHRLRVRATAKTWSEVTIDGHPMKRVFLAPGQSQEWLAKTGFTLSLGNVGAVKLTLDGHEVPSLDKAGQKALNVRLLPRQEVRQPTRDGCPDTVVQACAPARGGRSHGLPVSRWRC
ncbi:MAG: DUF4115 domain-containing protein [Deltaproteobacteria bacterium]|nr:DUF4115 domain-containing protein [Deltaproteobacteria bacterium]